ncbi:hypothetical protein KY092_13855 [Natronomonas gomsonensis]|jgi:uncharacterized membrane protein|uniref:DUF7470 family protein n=1 Tax=Natronomonas gomsonensis TaxID=1046043 RepID=UPI0020CA4618|nr:hypothetical protein [Natronomonas gomsonensis]MCY4731639.1 hypothetical protein [Natronomonas gomsonensis]
MSTQELTDALGDTGIAGAVLVVVGMVLLGRENRRAAFAATVVMAGGALLGHGLLGTFLESMGMSYDDL